MAKNDFSGALRRIDDVFEKQTMPLFDEIDRLFDCFDFDQTVKDMKNSLFMKGNDWLNDFSDLIETIRDTVSDFEIDFEYDKDVDSDPEISVDGDLLKIYVPSSKGNNTDGYTKIEATIPGDCDVDKMYTKYDDKEKIGTVVIPKKTKDGDVKKTKKKSKKRLSSTTGSKFSVKRGDDGKFIAKAE